MENVNKKNWREIRKPRVFISSTGFLYVIYNNKEVVYKLERVNTFKELSKELGREHTKEDSIRLCEDYREVHYTTDEDVKKAWDNILNKEA